MSERRISRKPDVMAGAYCISGTRIPVTTIRGCFRDWSVERILKEYPSLTRADVIAALSFRRPLPPPPLSDESHSGS